MSTFVEILRERADQQPNQNAFTFLENGEHEREWLTWSQLDHAAKRIALLLQSKDINFGDRVLIVYPPGLDCIVGLFGCFYAGAIAVPIAYGQPARLIARLQSLAEDCSASCILTTVATFRGLNKRISPNSILHHVRWVFSDANEDAAPGDNWHPPHSELDTIALLQYTSGSITTPKGVTISHRNLLCNEAIIERAFGHTSATCVVGWLPLNHDMGLIGNVLQTVYAGCRCVLMSPLDFIQEPMRWLAAISRYQGTTSGGPNFAYELCVSRFTPNICQHLDLSSWKLAFNGSEPVRAGTLERFAETFAPFGFRAAALYPCYGLAEATLFVTGGSVKDYPLLKSIDRHALEESRIWTTTDKDKTKVVVSCGRVPPELDLIVVNPESSVRLPNGSLGEIWIHGDTVASGYWNRPSEAAATFRAYVYPDGAGPYLRTGDLGFVHDSELFITGRLDDLIIVRGRNYYPNEIEQSVESVDPALRSGGSAAFLVNEDQQDHLVIVSEIKRVAAFDAVSLRAKVQRAIAEEFGLTLHEIVFVRPGQVPKTTSGKTRRNACREAFLAGQLRLAVSKLETPAQPVATSLQQPQLIDVETFLRGQVADLLKLPEAIIDQNKSLISLGIDSLATALLQQGLANEIGVQVSIAELLQAASLHEIAVLAANRRDVQSSPSSTRDHSFAPASEQSLTHGQRSFWFLSQLAPNSTAYHLARALRLTGDFDVSCLAHSLQEMSRRHTALRTTFSIRNGEPIQQIHAASKAALTFTDAELLSNEEVLETLAADANRPFDLEHGPLLRLSVYRRSATEHILLVVTHHLIMDLASMRILFAELRNAYAIAAGNGSVPSSPATQSDYHEFLRWERAYLASNKAREDLAFWRQYIPGDLQLLDLPYDRPRSVVKTYRGAILHSILPSNVTAPLKDLGIASGCTLYATLLALFSVLLSRYADSEHLVIGSPCTAREPAHNGLVGYCSNMLPLKADLSGNPPFRELLQRMRGSVLAALEHSHYPLPLLVEQMRVPRDAGRSPLFDVAFVWHGAVLNDDDQLLYPYHPVNKVQLAHFGPLSAEPVELPGSAAQFDLTLVMAETPQGVAATFEYNTDLFDAETIARMAEHFRILAEETAANPEQNVALIRLTDQKNDAFVASLKGPTIAYPSDLTVPLAFAQQVTRAPDDIAVAGAMGGRLAGAATSASYTYAQLDVLTNRLAHTLRDRYGIRSNEVVGILAQRSAAMVVGILAILKAGAAYLPLDPTEPKSRLEELVRNCGCRVLLTTESAGAEIHLSGLSVLDLADEQSFDSNESSLEQTCKPADLAYVIYTSGSTGKPKGVMIEHRSLMNRLLWMTDLLDIGKQDAILHKTPIIFDVSVWELLLPLMSGGQMVLLPPGGEREPDVLGQTLRSYPITTIHFIPSMLSAFLTHPASAELSRLKHCICSGEALSATVAARFFQTTNNRVSLYNFYGPTEAAIDVTHHRVSPDEFTIPLGTPAANTSLHVLDKYQKPAPIGVPGEIYISGIQLARGYVNEPELTAKSFLEDPAIPGRRIYRTGDRARLRVDGSLQYLGRRDDQVKIRGRRVELGEIATALRKHPHIRDAIVVARTSKGRDPSLVGYLIHHDSAPSRKELVAFLGQQLPAALIPSAFVYMDSFPRSPTGKIDVQHLPAPNFSQSEAAHEPPASAEEAALARLWEEELGVERIGVHDSFFDLGGDSIRSVRVVARARELGLSLTVHSIFQHQTIRELANHLLRDVKPGEIVPLTRPFDLVPPEWRANLSQEFEDAYPLSLVQRSMLFLSESDPSYEVYVTTLHLRVQFNEAAFRQSLERLIARHAFLRGSIDTVNFPEPLQCIHRFAEVPFEILDWRNLETSEQDKRLAQWLSVERKKIFDWSRCPLLRVTVHRRSEETIQFSFSDASLDGWCVATLITELFDDYLARLTNSSLITRPDFTASYRDFIALEQAAQSDAATTEFWQQQTSRVAPPLLLPPSRGSKTERRLQQRVTLIFEPAEFDRIKEVARANSVPVKSVLLAAHLRIVALLSRTSRVTTGIEMNGRPERIGGDEIVGVFNNMLPLSLTLNGGSWSDLIRETYAAESDILPFRRYPYALLRKKCGRQLFDTVFVYTHFHAYERLGGRNDFEVLDAYGTDQTFFPLTAHFNIDPLSSRLRLMLDFNPQILDAEWMPALLDHYKRAIAAIIHSPDASYDSLCFMSDAERLLIDQLNDTVSPSATARDDATHELIAKVAQQCPDSISVVCGDEHVTYRTLNEQSEVVSQRLRCLGVGPEEVVALCTERSPLLLIGLLGILKAGGAFLPLEATYPAQRLSAILQDSRVRFGVVDRAVHEVFSDQCGIELVCLDDLLSTTPDEISNVATSPQNAAYVMYTSGSTGRPKGIVVEHQALINYLNWSNYAYEMQRGCGAPVHTSPCFDLTLTSLLGPLLAGKTVYLLKDVDGVEALAEALQTGPEFSLIKLTPSHLRLLNLQRNERRYFAPPPALIVGGETLRAEMVAPWRNDVDMIVNEYGPTEATVGCCCYRAPHDRELDNLVPIGIPIANVRAYVLDQWLHPVPAGVVGELCIGGMCLARGYYNQPQLTAANFMPDPFGREPGALLYRTGDLARRRLDGELEYMGRADQQIKLRGYRIEIAEIEGVMGLHPDVQSAAVVVRQNPGGNEQLVGYVTSRGTTPIRVSELRSFLREQLPEYMIPSLIVPIATMPLTNGKIDRERLREHFTPAQERARISKLLLHVESRTDEEVAAMQKTSSGTVSRGLPDG